MRRTLGTLAIALALAGCGDDPEPTATVIVDRKAEDPVLVSGTAGRGEPATEATDVSDKADLATYVAQFEDALAAKVMKAAAAIDGDTVLAQVVAIGCDVPESAHLQGDAIVPAKVAKPMQECFAPVTTVAVVEASG